MEFFVYGTLTDRETTAAVLDSFKFHGPAVLDGLHRVDGAYPTLSPGGSVEGRILETDAVEALDGYEGVDRGLYLRVEIPRDSGGTVQTYIGNPARLDVADEWPGEGTFTERVHSYLDIAAVLVRTEER